MKNKKNFRIRLCCGIVIAILLVLIFGGRFYVSNNEQILKTIREEYQLIGYEGRFYHFGEERFLGHAMGDLISLPFTNFPELVGVYAVEDDDLLYRDAPHNEWRAYYRKASLPPLEPSLDSVMRLELVPFQEDSLDHSSCGKGITDKAEIEAILTEIRAQGPCKQSELYDLVEKPDGFLENCYGYGRIYAFLADEPNLAIAMYITSYNDLAYSISIEEKEYLLTEKLLNRLLAANK